MDHPYADGTILKRLKRRRVSLWVSNKLVFVGVCSIAWLIFLLIVETLTPYAGAEWRHAWLGLALAVVMILLGLVGRAVTGRRVDELMPSLIEGCCADCGYTLGRPVFDGECPECGAALMRSKQRDRWMAFYSQRKAAVHAENLAD